MDWMTLMAGTDLSFLGDAAKSDLAQSLIVFGIMWRIIKKTIASHFEKIENSLDRIAKGFENHTDRIEQLESDFKELKLITNKKE